MALLAAGFAVGIVHAGRAKPAPAEPSDPESPAIDPQSAAFLDAIEAPDHPVAATAGTSLRLWSRLVFAELPGWDPSRDLHRIHTLWEQIAGPVAKLEDPKGAKTVAVLPEVTSTTRLEFRVTLSNRSGRVQRSLQVDVRPRPQVP